MPRGGPMPAERAPMRKVREVLRLRHALGVSERQIAVTVGVSRSTVGEHKASECGRCTYLARCLSGPALECMRECTHLAKAEQPRNLGYMQLGVIKVSNCQIAPQLLKYFSEVQTFVRKLSGQRPLAHSQTASNVIRHHPSVRKQRRHRVLNSRA